jgi:O-antigen/teichoic acid export membrane protein
MSLGKMWWAYILNLFWALVLLASASMLVPRYGALGLAEAFLAAYAANALAAILFAQVLFRQRLSRPADEPQVADISNFAV